MSDSIQAFESLATAEDYLIFLGVAYDPLIVQVVHVQLLRRFGARMREVNRCHPDLNWQERRILYQHQLRVSYHELKNGVDHDDSKDMEFEPSTNRSRELLCAPDRSGGRNSPSANAWRSQCSVCGVAGTGQ